MIAKHMTYGASPVTVISALFPVPEECERINDALTRQLSTADQQIAAGAVTPTLDLHGFQHELANFDFCRPRPLEEVLSWMIDGLQHGVVHVTHPRYFGLFNPAPTFPAQCADRIAAVLNPQLATRTTSPVAVEIETHVIRSIGRRAGFPTEAIGHFTSGGAEANYTALICALTRANPAFASDGARAFQGAPVFYVSTESHSSWIKIAHQAGIGRSAARLVATDGTGRMDPNALKYAMKKDRADGCVPVMVAATAGTTNAGMIDPLPACAEAAQHFSVWYHVDAAWGGALIVSDRLRRALAGIEQADSVTIDAHKWFATTMGCGMFITRDAQALSAAFHVSTGYMPSNAVDTDPYVMSVQWSRRFVGLRLFLSLAAAGWEGYAKHVERSIELGQLLREKLQSDGWIIANNSLLGVLCIRPQRHYGDVRAIVGRVLASGRAWVSVATFEGREIIRACITNGRTTSNDVFELVAALQASGGPE
jgi:glutamate/tyrosine decarboxylase-like PLP-dependent enzyme